jgi:hypothetical protein
MIQSIFPLPEDQETLLFFYQVTISIAGILFPVFQAVLFFIIEKSFSTFEHSRQYLIKMYRIAGNIITASLLILILLPLFAILEYKQYSIISIFIYVIYYIVHKTILFYETGLWTTINSTKFIPQEYGAIRRFIKTCWNNDIPSWINYLFWNALIIVLPMLIYVNNDFKYSDSLVFITVLVNLVFVLLTISGLLNNPVEIQQVVLKNEDNIMKEKKTWSESKRQTENNKINKLVQMSKTFSANSSKCMKYEIQPILRNDGTLWCNIRVSSFKINSIEELKKNIITISFRMLMEYVNWPTDINNVVLSWHITLDNKLKNIIIRTSKNEIKSNNKINSPEVFIKNLKNTLIDDIFL